MENTEKTQRPVILADGVPILSRPSREELKESGAPVPLYSATVRTIPNGAGKPGLNIVTVEIVLPGSAKVTMGPNIFAALERPLQLDAGQSQAWQKPAPEPSPEPPVDEDRVGARGEPGIPLGSPDVAPKGEPGVRFTERPPGAPRRPGRAGRVVEAPETPPAQFSAKNNGDEPEEETIETQEGRRHYFRNEWRYGWKVNYGPYPNMTLESIMRQYGGTALAWYYWRGVDQEEHHSGPGGNQDKRAINASMCQFIIGLWKQLGINEVLPRPTGKPGQTAGKGGK